MPENHNSNVGDSEVIEVWKKVVEVQQHFNDICLRIRNLAVLAVGAILTAGGFAAKDGVNIEVFDLQVPATIPIVLIALVTWLAFFLLDYCWYHRLLIGAVLQGEMIEKRHATRIPEMSLTQAISKNSPIVFSFRGKQIQIRSSAKLQAFYLIGAVLLLFIVLPFLREIQ